MTGQEFHTGNQFNAEDLRGAVRGAERPQEDSSPSSRTLTLDDFAEGLVVAFDPSLSATAYVVLHRTPTALQVLDAHTLRVESEESGWVGAFEKAALLERRLHQVFAIDIAKVRLEHDVPPDYRMSGKYTHIVHEAPPSGGGASRAKESSPMAGREIRRAASAYGVSEVSMVSPQSHKRLVTGSGNAGKPAVRSALIVLSQTLPIGGYRHVSNEDERDALCVALTVLYRQRHP